MDANLPLPQRSMMSRELSRDRFTLLDVILAVQDEAKDDREALAALMHLLDPAAGGCGNASPRRANLIQGL